jgi:serine-type D-Ala-D-Ala carboxypeptidase/endopeptidase (penicillin-binding protein 4)
VASNGSQPPGARGRASVPPPGPAGPPQPPPEHGGPPSGYGPPPPAPAWGQSLPLPQPQNAQPQYARPPALPPPPVMPPAAPPRKRRTGLIVGLITVLLLALAVGGVVVVRPGPVAGWLGEAPAATPSPTQPPEPSPSPVLAAVAADAPIPTGDGLEAALDALVAAANLGSNANLSVRDVATGEALYDRGADRATVPASTMKLVTAATVLATRGPAYRIPTRVVAGANPGEVVLIGGGDPTLSIGAKGYFPGAGRLDLLAAQVKKTGITPTKVIIDGSLYKGPVIEPGWDPDIPTGGFAGVATALMTNGTRIKLNRLPNYYAERYAQPDVAAGQAFAKALGLPASAVSKGTAPAGSGPEVDPSAGPGPTASADPTVAGAELGRVLSPPMLRLVEFMLVESDNVVGEALARQVAIAKGEPASFIGAAAAMKAVLAELGLPTTGVVLADGSGLSRTNRLTPALLTALLAKAGDGSNPALSPIFSGLPVAAWSGTLTERFKGTAARAGVGAIRAKTGSLNKVSAMSGIVTTADGRLLSFAMLADQVPGDPDAARAAYDRIAAKLATCGCR